MDIKPCPKCGCGSNNEEGQLFPYAIEYGNGVSLVKVMCGQCGVFSLADSMKDAVSDWNAGDVV